MNWFWDLEISTKEDYQRQFKLISLVVLLISLFACVMGWLSMVWIELTGETVLLAMLTLMHWFILIDMKRAYIERFMVRKQRWGN